MQMRDRTLNFDATSRRFEARAGEETLKSEIYGSCHEKSAEGN